MKLFPFTSLRVARATRLPAKPWDTLASDHSSTLLVSCQGADPQQAALVLLGAQMKCRQQAVSSSPTLQHRSEKRNLMQRFCLGHSTVKSPGVQGLVMASSTQALRALSLPRSTAATGREKRQRQVCLLLLRKGDVSRNIVGALTIRPLTGT